MSGRKFDRPTGHRQMMTRNQCTSLLEHGRITTTEAKAKELRRWVERLITTSKQDTVAARRQVASELTSPAVVQHLFDTLMPRLKDRSGGYTRIVKTGPRLGDGAPMVIIELVD